MGSKTRTRVFATFECSMKIEMSLKVSDEDLKPLVMFGGERTECSVEILGLSCEIDIRYVPTLRAAFRRKIAGRCKALILDLTEVYDIDSSAIATLVDYYRDAGRQGGVLCLCGVNEGLKPMFEAVELGKCLAMFDSVADAVAAITRGEIQPYGPAASTTHRDTDISARILSR